MKKERLVIVDYFMNTGDTVEEKMRKSAVCVLVINRRYIRELKVNESSIVEPLEAAKKLKKDTIIIIDNRLEDGDVRLIENYLIGLRIVRRDYVDTSDAKLVARIIGEVYSVYDVE